MIKIITRHSAEGGSTTILANLTNMFNNAGYDCIMYGPHDFYRNLCRNDKFENLRFQKNDIIIAHITEFIKRPDVKKIIYYCHEKWWWKRLDEINNYWDLAVFSHEDHRQYHSYYTGPAITIPNPKSDLVFKDKPELDLVAGIIGTVEDRKQTHKSIERAFKDGCTDVYIFGKTYPDSEYYKKFIKKYTYHENVHFMGYADDKQAMYDMIGRVYHLSKGEVACLVKDECEMTGTKFFGNEETAHLVSPMNNQELLEIWKKTLDL